MCADIVCNMIVGVIVVLVCRLECGIFVVYVERDERFEKRWQRGWLICVICGG